MKKHIKLIALFSVVTAALIVLPAISRAQDASDSQTTPAAKNKALPFRGKVTAVDTNAMTLTVTMLNCSITCEYEIAKAGQPATLPEIACGGGARGSYR